ncbi:MAG TPA: flagellar biosynthetic protein FliQ [Candidatus Avimonas sp.]|nr:flagellar biosynthetic protein FliQ [Candidatus Avimonas sp.]
MITGVLISAPFLIVSVVIGIIISVLQAATQVHEQTLTFVPKIIAAALILILLGSWIINILSGFTENVFNLISNL